MSQTGDCARPRSGAWRRRRPGGRMRYRNRDRISPVQIGARAKGFSISRQNDQPYFIPAAEFFERFGYLFNEFVVKGIVYIGTIEKNECYILVNIDLQHDTTS